MKEWQTNLEFESKRLFRLPLKRPENWGYDAGCKTSLLCVLNTHCSLKFSQLRQNNTQGTLLLRSFKSLSWQAATLLFIVGCMIH